MGERGKERGREKKNEEENEGGRKENVLLWIPAGGHDNENSRVGKNVEGRKDSPKSAWTRKDNLRRRDWSMFQIFKAKERVKKSER